MPDREKLKPEAERGAAAPLPDPPIDREEFERAGTFHDPVDTDPHPAQPGEHRIGGPAVVPEGPEVYLPPGTEHAQREFQQQRLKTLRAELDAEYERQKATPAATHETAWVEALPGQEDRVVLWEDHPLHPGGEAILAPGHVRLVALTAGVVSKIRAGKLKVVDEPDEVLDEQPWIGKPRIEVGRHPSKPARPKATYRRPRD